MGRAGRDRQKSRPADNFAGEPPGHAFGSVLRKSRPCPPGEVGRGSRSRKKFDVGYLPKNRRPLLHLLQEKGALRLRHHDAFPAEPADNPPPPEPHEASEAPQRAQGSTLKLSLPGQTILLSSPALIVGTQGPDEEPNMMNAAWGGIVLGQPPCLGVSPGEATLTFYRRGRDFPFSSRKMRCGPSASSAIVARASAFSSYKHRRGISLAKPRTARGLPS